MFDKMKLGHRIAVAAGIGLVFFAIVSAFAVYRVGLNEKALTEISEVNAVKQRYAINFRGSVHDRAIEIRDVVLMDDEGAKAAELMIDKLAADYDASAGPLDAMMVSSEDATEAGFLNAIKEIEIATLPIVDEIRRLRNAGDMTAAQALLMGEARPNFILWLARINAFIDHQEAKTNALADDVHASVASFKFLIAGMFLAALIVSVLAIRHVSSGLKRSMSGLIGAMDKLSVGDVDAKIPVEEGDHELARISQALHGFSKTVTDWVDLEKKSKEAAHVGAERAQSYEDVFQNVKLATEAAIAGDFSRRVPVSKTNELTAELADDVNRMLSAVDDVMKDMVSVVTDMSEGRLDNQMKVREEGVFAELSVSVNETLVRLRDIISRVADSGAGIESEVEQISSNASNLSERSANQAATLEENSATMEEITSTVKSNADNAEDALRQAHEASERANRGGTIVGDAAAAMQRINESSSKISDIVSVIDSIAFQTNLLALNAAVEAARAGESGKGFAVVASEVRTLAQRSSESARDIRELIDNSSSYVADGVRLVASTGDALNEIVTSITSVSATVGEITEASKEQAKGVEEISASIANLDNITQENAVIASTNAGSAGELKIRAKNLRDLLAFFQGGAAAAITQREEPPATDWTPAAEPAGRGVAAIADEIQMNEEAADAAWEELAARDDAAGPEPELEPGPSAAVVNAAPDYESFVAKSESEESWSEF